MPDVPPPSADDRFSALDAELERVRAWIEERAGEHHLRHSSVGKEDRFWGCSRLPCRQYAAFLRGLTRFRCRTREAGTAGGNEGQDCDWPFCGCYPEATKVLEAVEESGRFVQREALDAAVSRAAVLEAALARLAEAARPFAEYARHIDGFAAEWADGEEISDTQAPSGRVVEGPTLGDCRRLRDAVRDAGGA